MVGVLVSRWKTPILSSLVAIVLFLMPLAIVTPVAHAAASTAAAGSLSEYENGNLDSKDLSGQDLNGAQFANARLKGTKFNNANLIGSVFSTSTLRETSFQGADMTQTIFDQVRLFDVDFSDTNLTDAMLLRAEFNGTTQVDGADFSDALLSPLQVKALCANASGTNSQTGMDTRETLGGPD